MTTPIFRTNGQHFGFIIDSNLFDCSNKFIGHIKNNEVWKQNGEYLGEIYSSNYILCELNSSKENIEAVPDPEFSPIPRVPLTRSEKEIPVGMSDALANI